jgi:hypothetical protein
MSYLAVNDATCNPLYMLSHWSEDVKAPLPWSFLGRRGESGVLRVAERPLWR